MALREFSAAPRCQRNHQSHQRGNTEIAEISEIMPVAEQEEDVVPVKTAGQRTHGLERKQRKLGGRRAHATVRNISELPASGPFSETRPGW